MATKTVDVLLAAYQSEQYLPEQLQSLLEQDCDGFRVLIRDGGSTDGTVALIRQWCERYPEKFVFIGSGRAGTRENFAALMAASDAPYIMFCDHDDRWMPDKISVSLERCRRLEAQHPAGTPVLVFSDALVTDDRLQIIDRSNFHFQQLDPARIGLFESLLQNVPFGNTMCFNRALAEMAGPVPPEAFMHDHWITLIGTRFGVVGQLENATLYYRQHRHNLFGMPCFSLPHLCRRAIFTRAELQRRIFDYCRQAAVFRERFGAGLSPEENRRLQLLATIPAAGFWGRRMRLWQSGARKNGWRRNLGLFIVL
ncbi:MAG: glycosyltransferase [Lentisphaeria bacterium]|nr:glycosyltransferase [Lentisphaeria bacterium]